MTMPSATCPYCGGPEHTDEKELALEVFVDRYRRSGKATLHEFAASELARLMKQAEAELRGHISPKDLANYARVVTEGTIELTIMAADHLRKHTQ